MILLPSLLSLVAVTIVSFLWTRLSKPLGLVDYIVNFYTFSTAQIIAAGYILSRYERIHAPVAWVLLNVGLCVLTLAILSLQVRYRSTCFRRVALPEITPIREELHRLSSFEKRLLTALAATATAVGILNFVVLVSTAPHNVDSMFYHLTRMAYYLQQGHLGYYDATYWAQIVHPKNSTILQIYTYLMSGRSENLTQLVQFVAYWVSIVVVFGISRSIGMKRSAALFAALVFALLIQCVMQSNTTQNDIQVALYMALAVYSILSFHSTAKRGYLLLAGIQLAMALGTKMTVFLAFPSVAVIAALALRPKATREASRALLNIGVFSLAFLIGVVLFAVPSGYLENYHYFGHPLGPKEVRNEHNEVGNQDNFVFHGGTSNLVRLGFDFLTLDGLPPAPPVMLVQRVIRTVPQKATLLLGVDLEKTNSSWRTFYYQRRSVAHEDESFLGVFGFALIWPAVFLFLWGVPQFPKGRWLALGAAFVILMLGYGLAYEPWHGRRAIMFACFGTPLVGSFFYWKEKRWLRYYLTLIVGIGCLSAFSAVLFRHNGALLPRFERSIFQMDRLQQLTRNDPEPEEYGALRKFDDLVPARATVAVCLRNYFFEYPLFGKGLTRRLVQLNSFWRGKQPIPDDADYLLYSKGYYERGTGDIELGKDWYLRKLVPQKSRVRY
jgi:4-amino-4-deoxy-L-arabinose transferase-like glycosyltransferase